MKVKIWTVLAQILFYRNDLIEIIKPFFENLKKENINDEKYIPLLKTFPKDQLEVLYKNGIITEKKFNSLLPKNQNQLELDFNFTFLTKKASNITVDEVNTKINTKIEEIISGDKIKELQEFVQEKDIKTFNMITKYFLEVERMEIPLIQYCIMKKAIECFKYLLVNGYDDPNKTMKEQNPDYFYNFFISEVYCCSHTIPSISFEAIPFTT